MPPDVPARVPLPIAMPDDAFGAALIEQAAALSAYARRLTGGGADADDLLQDTMLRCWTARASFAAGTSLAAWARTVMKNSFLTGRRRARFHADLPEEARDRMLRVDETQSLAVWLRDTCRRVDRFEFLPYRAGRWDGLRGSCSDRGYEACSNAASQVGSRSCRCRNAARLAGDGNAGQTGPALCGRCVWAGRAKAVRPALKT